MRTFVCVDPPGTRMQAFGSPLDLSIIARSKLLALLALTLWYVRVNIQPLAKPKSMESLWAWGHPAYPGNAPSLEHSGTWELGIRQENGKLHPPVCLKIILSSSEDSEEPLLTSLVLSCRGKAFQM